mmetsp:Transcript_3131/g.1842  ORF Transcript_3131/g.1842 Transcript_3131/m.1842 type:complete len:275 (+) Transcript_3131:1032-1856(+)
MHSIEHLIDIALAEDIGSGDITTESLIEKNMTAKGIIFAKESLIIAGLDVAKRVFEKLESKIVLDTKHKDGDFVKKEEIILEAKGTLYALLTGERTALNFLQRLSGIATNVRSYADALQGNRVRLVDTRKTTPGWRVLEKYAVRIGGASNHRSGLYDGVLIKDNHITACGGITKAVKLIMKNISHLLKVEVEVSDLAQVKEAVEAGADVIMLDNMELDMIKKAVKIIDKKAIVEISGGLTIKDLKNMASTGVDLISVGALTHSARSVDISMKIC